MRPLGSAILGADLVIPETGIQSPRSTESAEGTSSGEIAGPQSSMTTERDNFVDKHHAQPGLS